MHKFLLPVFAVLIVFAVAQPQVHAEISSAENNLSTSLLAATASAKHTTKSTTPDTIPINPHQVVSIRVSPMTVSEDSRYAAIFTIWRAGATTTSLTIPFTMTGTATRNADYRLTDNSLNPLPGNTATIPAGAVSTTVRLFPITDAIKENTETATLSIASSTGYTLGSANSVTTSITDVPPISKPVVSVSVSSTTVAESSKLAAIFTIWRTGSSSPALLIPFTMSGSATRNLDYFLTDNGLVPLTGNTATIPSGSLSTTVRLFPKTDSIKESTETAILTVASSSTYNLGTTHSAMTSITDVVPPAPVISYTVLVASTTSLDQASTTVAASGGTVMYGLQYLHALIIQATASQSATLAAHPGIQSLQPTILAKDFGTAGTGGGTLPAGKISDTVPRVAIVDRGEHAIQVYYSYMKACGSNCADTSPIMIDDAPGGILTDASIDDGIMRALNQGATIVNVSQGNCSDEECSEGYLSSPADERMLDAIQGSGATLVLAAGDTYSYTQPLWTATNVIVVGSLDPTGQLPDLTQSTAADVYSDNLAPNGDYGTSFAAAAATAYLANTMSATQDTDTVDALTVTEADGKFGFYPDEKTDSQDQGSFEPPDDSSDSHGDCVDKSGGECVTKQKGGKDGLH